MKRAAWLGVALVMESAAADEPAWSKRLDEARNQAMAERKRLGLDRDQAALYGKYPTPEIVFASQEAIPMACPGKTVAVHLPGKLAPGSTVIVQSDDVEVLKQQLNGGAWDATLRAKPGAAPGAVSVVVASPVSFATRSERLLRIACPYRWRVTFSGGDAFSFKTTSAAGADEDVAGEWMSAGKKLSATYRARLEDDGTVRVQRKVSGEETQKRASAIQTTLGSPAMKKLDARMKTVMEKLQGCTQRPTSEMQKCMESLQTELNQIAQERNALIEKSQTTGAPALGCDEVTLHPQGGKLSGTASGCAGQKPDQPLEVAGTYSSL